MPGTPQRKERFFHFFRDKGSRFGACGKANLRVDTQTHVFVSVVWFLFLFFSKKTLKVDVCEGCELCFNTQALVFCFVLFSREEI